jgi:hypothetical protein
MNRPEARLFFLAAPTANLPAIRRKNGNHVLEVSFAGERLNAGAP